MRKLTILVDADDTIEYLAEHNRKFDAEAHGINRVSDWRDAYNLILDYALDLDVFGGDGKE